jgi:2,3-bisphosphoglycerate-independent phosphoglycerate mutase
MPSKKVCLIIIDGWGIGRNDHTNPIFLNKAPFIDGLKQNYPYYALQTSGIASGLNFLEEGSSEVGHLIIGSGKIIYQAKTRIDQSISNNSFLENPTILSAINHAKTNNSTLHLLGVISSSDSLASISHLIALIYMIKSNGISNICLHLISDGKDGAKNEVLNLIQTLNQESSRLGAIKIGSISGRFYALNDHNEMYLEKYCNFLVDSNSINSAKDLESHLLSLQEKSITDEFIEPFAIKDTFKPITNNDSLIIFNLKPNSFPIEYLIQKLNTNISSLTNLNIVSFVDMKNDLNVKIAFPNEKVENSLSMVLSQNQKRQAHLTESLKSLHVTYYFNGLNQKPFPGEYWFILPSDTSFKFQENPYLEAPNITERAKQIIDESVYDFLLINYPNADLAGHTGDIDIAKTAVSIIDNEIQKLVEYGLKHDYVFIITSDHGNIERMKNPLTGESEYQHDDSFVPVHLVSNFWKLPAPLTLSEIQRNEKTAIGILADISPTILNLFNIKQPIQMTGQSLLTTLNLPTHEPEDNNKNKE